MDITFITGNAAKAEQVARYLDYPLKHHRYDLTEIQSLSLEEVVRHKALEAYSKADGPVLVEDVALTFEAFGKLPGPLIKWFLQELGNEGLCRLVDGKNRTVTAEVLFGLHDGGETHLFHGSCVGTVAEHPRGDTTFGWDPIFIPSGYDKTWAEMDTAEQAETSMRKIALTALKQFLTTKHVT